MKKISLILILATAIFAGEFENNFAKNLKNNFKLENFKIISVDKFKSIQNLNLVVFEDKDSNFTTAVFTSKDGKSIMTLPKFINFSDENDNELLNKKIEKINQDQKAKQEKIVYEIIKTIPEDRFVKINSFDKNNKKIMYMITDPECPYCRAEMSKLVKWIRNANLRIIFAPVHGKSSFTKAAIILKEATKIDPNNQEKLIKLFDKYYDEKAVVSNNDASDSQRDAVLADAKKLFSKGAIKGVPFSFVIE